MAETQAEARAQVSVLPDLPPTTTQPIASTNTTGRGTTRRVNEIAEAALLDGEAVNIDQAGEDVRNLMVDFLYNYYELMEVENDNVNVENTQESSMDDHNVNTTQQHRQYFPYVEQAQRLAEARLSHFQDDDFQTQQQQDNYDDNDSTTNTNPTTQQNLHNSFQTTLFVDFTHVQKFNHLLAEAIESDYIRFEPYLRKALQIFLFDTHPQLATLSQTSHPTTTHGSNTNTTSSSMGHTATSLSTSSTEHNNAYFLAMHNLPHLLPLRSLRTDTLSKLVTFSGTITRTSDVRPELTHATFRCIPCGMIIEHIPQQYHYTRPTTCRNPGCHNTTDFTLDISSSIFVDWQKLKIQENSQDIPPGCMPRSMDVVVRNEMVEKCKAGDCVVIVGSFVVIPDGGALARAGEAVQSYRSTTSGGNSEAAAGGVSGLKALGVRELTYKTCFVATTVLHVDSLARYKSQKDSFEASAIANFLYGNINTTGQDGVGEDDFKNTMEVALELTAEEKLDIANMKNTPNLYQKMVNSICPATFGHLEVKRGVLLQLLGGVHKTTPEGMRLRGDINVCIIGDPSTAKSQFLKYVHNFLPNRSVYTSGKASSAAGLTAAVQRDQDTGEYCIEAGALMLADNGICCIDEFDKMDPTDQVAIHEAMEQQTISITKAGIQATLNARASILAAANPIYGRYDRTKTLKANVALSAPILSRFDLFFIVLDECDEQADYNVAKHILDVHRCEEELVSPPFTKKQLQRYIRFARTINPKISTESQRVLVDCYQKLRQGDTMGSSRTAYRITVRQLESMIRLSEALARLHCDPTVRPIYVREAFRLLQKSIIHVETEDITFDEDEPDPNDENGENDDTDDKVGATNYSSEDNQNRVGEYQSSQANEGSPHNADDNSSDTRPVKRAKKSKKKKTQITFDEYQEISNAIATYLRSNEKDDSSYLSWGQTVEWYLDQRKSQVGDSDEELERLRKLTNLVIKRLINVDNVLHYVGGDDVAESEYDRILAVHPNHEI